jgi:Ca2+-binding RTX toxin-like protein
LNGTISEVDVSGNGSLELSGLYIGDNVNLHDAAFEQLSFIMDPDYSNDTLDLSIDNVVASISGNVDTYNIVVDGGFNYLNFGNDGQADAIYVSYGGSATLTSLTLDNVDGYVNASDYDGFLTVNAEASATILGGSNADTINGSYQSDMLQGNFGEDVLTGGDGNDLFVFTNADGADVDLITDFSSGADEIGLSFGGLNWFGNDLDYGYFYAAENVGDDVLSAHAYVLYDTSTGALYYDVDGSTTGDAVQFAQLGEGGSVPSLSHTDITGLGG